MSDPVFDDLVALTRHLGETERNYVILGEGNTSARIDAETYWIKASGLPLEGIAPDGFTRVRTRAILDLIDGPDLDDAAIRAALTAAKVDASGRHPSIETLVHALAIHLCGATFVGHTHPTALNAILCSRGAREALSGHLYPETALYMGPNPLIVPYADPGVPLARAVKAELVAHLDRFGAPPRVFYLLSHGLFVLGATTAEVRNITAMAVKAAAVLQGTYALGGPAFMTDAQVDRICTRPDEIVRRKAANAVA
jgi:rhamnose utilization protein RhaD (predicted bifunctional aldolase and dehydrogenase)